MGRMKELYCELLEANQGEIPHEATIADLARMNDLKIFEWREYERSQNNLKKPKNEGMEKNQTLDSHIEELARQSCEEFSYLENARCPNCFNTTLHGNIKEAVCEVCAQEFIYVGPSLRFK
jgi:hypothetical protein